MLDPHVMVDVDELPTIDEERILTLLGAGTSIGITRDGVHVANLVPATDADVE